MEISNRIKYFISESDLDLILWQPKNFLHKKKNCQDQTPNKKSLIQKSKDWIGIVDWLPIK